MDFPENKADPKQELLFPDVVSTYHEGKDEMNLAEFPIAAIGYRIESAQKTIVYQDETFDKALGKTITRKLTITASDDYGLPTATDDEALLGLLQLTYKQGFRSRTINFRPIELLRILGWSINGGNYDRLRDALSRWVGVTLRYNNAWRDKASGQWKDKEFHIIEAQSFTSSVNRGNASLDGAASFTWNEVVFTNFQAGNLKSLDFEFYRNLKSSIAKRMFRFLDKRFYLRKQLTFDLETFAFEKVGLSRGVNMDMGQVKRRLTSAIEELERMNFIKAKPSNLRFTKQLRRGHWDVHFEKFEEGTKGEMALNLQVEEFSALESRLMAHGITPSQIRKMVSEYDPQRIEAKLDSLDFLIARKDSSTPQNAAGWLVKAITEDWTAPRGFVSPAEMEEQARLEAEKIEKQAELTKRRTTARKATDAAKAAAFAAEQEKIRSYLATLPESDREALETEAVATSPLTKDGRIGPSIKKSVIDNFVLKLLEKQSS